MPPTIFLAQILSPKAPPGKGAPGGPARPSSALPGSPAQPHATVGA
jgi:hypothetical protein